MPRPTLVSLHYSPWSEKARWALDHHGIEVEGREHLILFGMPALRLRARRLTGRLSVPLLIDGADTYDDSILIAQWADARGAGTPLFPRGRADEIARWNKVVDDAMAAARALLIPRVLADAAAKRESLKGAVPRGARGLLAPIATVGARYLEAKYQASNATSDEHRATLEDALVQVHRGLEGPHLVGAGFTFADIAGACLMQFIQPVDDAWLRLGPATRRAWTMPDLAAEHAELLAWRDRMYADFRRPTPGAAPRPDTA